MEFLADLGQGHQQSTASLFALAPIFLSPLRFSDGRVYDLLETRVYRIDHEIIRWVTLIEVQSRCCEVSFLSKTYIHVSALERKMGTVKLDEGQLLADLARESTEQYLRFHPEPERLYNYRKPLIMESA